MKIIVEGDQYYFLSCLWFNFRCVIVRTLQGICSEVKPKYIYQNFSACFFSWALKWGTYCQVKKSRVSLGAFTLQKNVVRALQYLVQYRQILERNIGVSTGPWVPMASTGPDHVFLLCKHTFHHLMEMLLVTKYHKHLPVMSAFPTVLSWCLTL